MATGTNIIHKLQISLSTLINAKEVFFKSDVKNTMSESKDIQARITHPANPYSPNSKSDKGTNIEQILDMFRYEKQIDLFQNNTDKLESKSIQIISTSSMTEYNDIPFIDSELKKWVIGVPNNHTDNFPQYQIDEKIITPPSPEESVDITTSAYLQEMNFNPHKVDSWKKVREYMIG